MPKAGSGLQSVRLSGWQSVVTCAATFWKRAADASSATAEESNERCDSMVAV